MTIASDTRLIGRPRQPVGLRVAASMLSRTSRAAGFEEWLAQRRATHRYSVTTVALQSLAGWRVCPRTGDIQHARGSFFEVAGISVSDPDDRAGSWQQPIMHQPEVGILGFLVREFDGILHCLVQAKMEPGNTNQIQLSPTVQATRSNYTRAHGGRPVRYLEFFTGERDVDVVADSLQSEHGSWFVHKRNRNLIVETTEEVPVHEDFHWIPLGHLHTLLGQDNLVNMDSRTVLSCLPMPPEVWLLKPTFFASAVVGSDGLRQASRSWLTGIRAGTQVRTQRIALGQTSEWSLVDGAVRREDGRYFSVVGVDVCATGREVQAWSQPIFAPHGMGEASLVVREREGRLEVLLQARSEAGFVGNAELGPTVQCVPSNYEGRPQPELLSYVQSATGTRVLFSAIHSEEGGRLLHADSRYSIVTADADLPDPLPATFHWFTMGEIYELLQHSHYVNVQARTLIACLNSLAAS